MTPRAATASTSSPTAPSSPTGVDRVNGRPRDPRIDGAVLQAARDLLEEVGYLQLTIGAIADRAGTNKPAIYRRWPTKAHLVHEAVFPAEGPEVIPPDDDLRSDIRALVGIGVELLGRPAARAALPGLMAEMTSDPTLAGRRPRALRRRELGVAAGSDRRRGRGRRGAGRRAVVDRARAHRRLDARGHHPPSASRRRPRVGRRCRRGHRSGHRAVSPGTSITGSEVSVSDPLHRRGDPSWISV